MKIRPLRAELFHAVKRTDRWTDMTQKNSRFSQFCKKTKKKGFFRKKENVCKQIDFTLRTIYCSFSEAILFFGGKNYVYEIFEQRKIITGI
jgi:hypothetical protein